MKIRDLHHGVTTDSKLCVVKMASKSFPNVNPNNRMHKKSIILFCGINKIIKTEPLTSYLEKREEFQSTVFLKHHDIRKTGRAQERGITVSESESEPPVVRIL